MGAVLRRAAPVRPGPCPPRYPAAGPSARPRLLGGRGKFRLPGGALFLLPAPLSLTRRLPLRSTVAPVLPYDFSGAETTFLCLRQAAVNRPEQPLGRCVLGSGDAWQRLLVPVSLFSLERGLAKACVLLSSRVVPAQHQNLVLGRGASEGGRTGGGWVGSAVGALSPGPSVVLACPCGKGPARPCFTPRSSWCPAGVSLPSEPG